ncbi:MAG: hypothetical protein DRP87_04710 [Spirochaetes bacterium]|nr:MAG: hypothetical protein DRP87_04710 [Spirochaetota bacterium]
MIDKTINREDQSKILKCATVEQKLDALKRKSRELLELNPESGIRYLIESFRRKNRNDQQRAVKASR